MPASAIHVRVTGRVQGVGYRYAVVRAARELDLVGWVRNDVDGSVEVWAQGESASVDGLVRYLRVGPTGARVERVATSQGAVNTNLRGFDIRF